MQYWHSLWNLLSHASCAFQSPISHLFNSCIDFLPPEKRDKPKGFFNKLGRKTWRIVWVSRNGMVSWTTMNQLLTGDWKSIKFSRTLWIIPTAVMWPFLKRVVKLRGDKPLQDGDAVLRSGPGRINEIAEESRMWKALPNEVIEINSLRDYESMDSGAGKASLWHL